MAGLQMMNRARSSWALLPLRLMIGFGFAAHGYAKLVRGPDSFAGILAAMGLPLPEVTAWVTTLVELVGGVLLMLGLSVVPLVAPLAIIMVTALFAVHWRYGFSSIRLRALGPAGAEFGPIGYELNLLYLAGLLTLGLAGNSPLSVDRWLEARRTLARDAGPRSG